MSFVIERMGGIFGIDDMVDKSKFFYQFFPLNGTNMRIKYK